MNHASIWEFLGSEIGKFTKIMVSNCDETKPRCILKRGTNTSVAIEFTLSKSETSQPFLYAIQLDDQLIELTA